MISSFKQGHRDAAQGVDSNPFDFKTASSAHDAWINGHARVLEHRKNGLDPSGHAPGIPHLCERSISATAAAKVCNCCATCSTTCWAEKFEGTAERLKERMQWVHGSAKGLLRKMLRR